MTSRSTIAAVPLRARVAILLIATAPFTADAAHAQDRDVPALLQKYSCTICHARDETTAGPSWVDIAARYRGNPRAAAILAKVVKQGEHGSGPWPMPPLPQVPDADSKRIVEYILAQKR